MTLQERQTSRVVRIAQILLLSVALPGITSAAPADLSANPRVRTVLQFISTLETRPERRMLSGQFTDFGDNGTLAILERIHSETGHWPALAGFDYVDFNHGGIASKSCNQAAIAWWRSGGLVTVGVHLYDPNDAHKRGQNNTEVDLAELLRPTSPAHTAWMLEMDELAAGLQELRDAGVVVLWRPFHEMNGRVHFMGPGWFWWGAKDPAAFVKLWQLMFHYFTAEKHLDNLIWVYSPNQGSNADAYYPGDSFVDIVALDAYTNEVDPPHINGYDALSRIRKPFAFGEFGPKARPLTGDFDYRRLVEGVKRFFPRAIFFMSWNAKWSLAENKYAREALDDRWVVNRENLPLGLAGPIR